ncbi:MAG: DUF4190 domain-containing protein [Phycisphaerales bacterium]
MCAACGVRLPGSPNKDAEAVLKHLLPVKTSAWAIAAGYLGLLSPLMIFAPPAIFCGVAALIHLNKRPELRGVFRAWVGIVMGLLGTAMLLMLITQ